MSGVQLAALAFQLSALFNVTLQHALPLCCVCVCIIIHIEPSILRSMGCTAIDAAAYRSGTKTRRSAELNIHNFMQTCGQRRSRMISGRRALLCLVRVQTSSW